MQESQAAQGRNIAFLGAGKMAEAIIKGVLDAGLYTPEALLASDRSKNRMDFLRKTYGIRTALSNRDALHQAQVIFIAVKPVAVEAVLSEIAPDLGEKLLISVAAGVSISRIAAHLPKGARIIRVMPNAPAKVQAGASVLSPGDGVETEALELALNIFRGIGKAWVLEEGHLDAVTGLSGSGPAFVFVMIEALSDGGVKAGLPRALAQALAVQTVLGAARMVQELNVHPAQLKDLVSSPGGTTIAGLQQLEAGGLRSALMCAVEAATARSKCLAKPGA